MSWLDKFFIGVQFIQNNGVTLPQQPIVDIVGATSIVNDATNTRTVVTITPTPAAPTQVTVSASGPVTAQNGYEYFVNLYAAGGNVTFATSALTASQSFSVYIIDPSGSGTGGHSCTISPITAGNHIDALFPPSGPVAPGTLTTSAVLNAVGESISLTTPDGTNLWGTPS
jgi:hypothetical protein